jgi:hypothetical protein
MLEAAACALHSEPKHKAGDNRHRRRSSSVRKDDEPKDTMFLVELRRTTRVDIVTITS